MGLFLSMSAIADVRPFAVAHALRDYGRKHGFTVEPAGEDDSDGNLLIVTGTNEDHVLIRYPEDIHDFDKIPKALSRSMKAPVFGLHMHDGDLWMCTFFVEGRIRDRLNPIPEYWPDLNE